METLYLFSFSLIAYFVSFQGLNQGARNKGSLVGTAVLNLAEFATKTGEEFELDIPLALAGGTSESRLSFHVCLINCATFARSQTLFFSCSSLSYFVFGSILNF